MPSKHTQAILFLEKGFFEGLKSFRDFETRTEALGNTKEVGDAFEILVEAFLHLDPVLNAKAVWLVGNVPLSIRRRLNLPADTKGIDGVYEDVAGNLIPYQAKYRTDKDTLSYTEVSSFLGVTEESLQDRVIFTNARGLAADISNRKGLRSVRAAQFHGLTEEDFTRIQAWLCDKKTELNRWEPKPHQRKAIEEITAQFQHASRATAVLACGTGKTLVALWAAEKQEPKTVLVLVPSLALLSQTLPEWCRQTKWGDRFRYLCVCSDSSVDQSAQNDDYALKQSDLEFTVTTEAKRVQEFLAANPSGVNVIFSTYQSAEVVAAGLNGAPIDFGVFDEAHKTTGPKEGLFAFGLSDANILIKKRLFLTATPRHYDLRKRDKDGDFSTVSMSDDQVYGKVAYRLSFSAAVAAGIIVPYKVIISVSLNKEVDDEFLRNGITLVRRDQIQAKWVANQIALKRAIEKTSATKIITFHSRVKLAEEFASGGPQGFSEHVKGFEVFHVNGGQSAADRKAVLESFKATPKGLISNARCLTEGVDVPSVDMVAFVDPRKSRIDIAQAAGRAMRQSKATNKQQGYIVVPLFIEQQNGETEAQALARTGFEEVAMVLGAMLENDDDLVDIIRELQEAKGRGDQFNPRSLHEKIEVLGPAIDLEDLKRSIDVEIVARLGMGWDHWFGLLQKFHAREGHCRVANKLQEDGLILGTWVAKQRSNRDRLLPDQVQRLDYLGFSWDPHTEAWEANFEALRKFYERGGHCRVARNHKENGLKLGLWVGSQRVKKETLSPDQIQRLNELGFSWDPRADVWEEYFSALQRFHARESHCSVSGEHLEDDLKLGDWVSNLRQKRDKLLADQVQRLDQLGFSWDPLSEAWATGFAALEKFKRREGHSRVAHSHEEDGLKLGGWVLSQRQKRSTLSPEQVQRLEQLGFCWDPLVEVWETNFAALQTFHTREGHCRVAQSHKEDGVNLGSWVTTQRTKRDALTSGQIHRLEQLGFCWDPLAEAWEANFAALQRFHAREGHCRVARVKPQGSELNLGAWVQKQRDKKATLLPDRIERLESLGFSWDPLAEAWNSNFAALLAFHAREGHCRVPKGHKEHGLKLGDWVSYQRAKWARLLPEQVQRLEKLGFNWDPFAEAWDANFAALQKFHAREGHCRVSDSHQTDGLNLSSWVRTQRSKRGTLSPEQIQLLNGLGFCWDPFAEAWEANFAALQKFHTSEGHCRVPGDHSEGGFKLKFWVSNQRAKRENLTTDQIQRLEQLGFCWDPLVEVWETNFAALQRFHAREGHCRVVRTHQEGELKLGAWVKTQRSNRYTLSPEKIQQLERLGFSWDPRAEAWEANFAALQMFHAREGHCRVPGDHQEDGLKLGIWVENQRVKRDELSPEQIERLTGLGLSWDPRADVWQANFAAYLHRDRGCFVRIDW